MPGKIAEGILQGAREAVDYAKGARKGYKVHRIKVPDTVNVRAIRERSGLSQAKFAAKYGFSARTVSEWEQGHRKPNRQARILLRVIEAHPTIVEEVLAN